MEPVLLEDWLQKSQSLVPSVLAAPAPRKSSIPAPMSSKSRDPVPDLVSNSIVHSWAKIRLYVLEKRDLTNSDVEPFELLTRHLRSLHLADSQAKLLQALLTDVSSSNDAAIVGVARRFAITGLLKWIRASLQPISSSSAASHHSAREAVESVSQSVRKSLAEVPLSDSYVCEALLLLGTVANLAFVPASVKDDCCMTIARVLDERRQAIAGGKVAHALAGAGYALATASTESIQSILKAILFIWTPPDTEIDRNHKQEFEEDGIGLKVTCLNEVVMVLHLMDYLCSIFLARASSTKANPVSQVELMHGVLRGVMLETQSRDRWLVSCSTVMACVGLVRSLYRWDQFHTRRRITTPGYAMLHVLLKNLEDLVAKICDQALTLDVPVSTPSEFPAAGVRRHAGDVNLPLSSRSRELLRCVSVAVSRCRDLSPSPDVRRCLILSIFSDALSLEILYPVVEILTGVNQFTKLQQDPKCAPTQEVELPKLQHMDLRFRGSQLQVHVNDFFFQEMGAVVRALCEQCRWAHGDEQQEIELLVVEYTRSLYGKHRVLLAMGQKVQWEGWKSYKQTLEDALEAAFLTVAIFFSFRIREPTKPMPNARHRLDETKRAAIALDALSCVEYFRHVHLKEFSEVVQLSVSHITGSEAASVSLARLMPTYQDLTQRSGTSDVNPAYGWVEDEVQTARILFYFRVMPSCLIKLPGPVFGTEVASTMFLYMHHPSDAVSKAAHTLFAAFLSLGVGSEVLVKPGMKKVVEFVPIEQEVESAITLRESLAVYYIQKALQEFPGVTPFEGLVAGLGVIARQLPEGSPAVVYCLNCLAEKASSLYKTDVSGTEMNTAASESQGLPHADVMRKTTDDGIGAAQRLHLLLLHLTLLVDLQVLPVSLKLVAKIILTLPQHLQVKTLAEAFDVVGSSDDYTRKPIIVPWLQSLAFLVLDKPKESQNHKGDNDTSSSGSHHESMIETSQSEASLAEDAVQDTHGDENQFRKEHTVPRDTLVRSDIKVAHDGEIGDGRPEMQGNEGRRPGGEGLEVRSRL